MDTESLMKTIDEIYRDSSSKILATLIRLLGDFDKAEDALQEAFRLAAEQWSKIGVPEKPVAWLVSAGKFRAIDFIRRQRKVRVGLSTDQVTSPLPDFEKAVDETIRDDTLRLIFLCCHPRLSLESQIALILREVCGMSTEEIAAAFLVTVPTVAQRLVRAKATLRKIRHQWVPPEGADLDTRLGAVLHVIYLIFNEGYFASAGHQLIRTDLVDEAIRLGRLLLSQIQHSDALGLLGLMILQKARLPSRVGADGELVLLEDQDRSLWNPGLIKEGSGFVRAAMTAGPMGYFTLQAAIVAVHSTSPSVEATDWKLIVELYEYLSILSPSPVFELNLCIALAMVRGPEIALSRLEPLFGDGGPLSLYAPGHLARGELAFRAGDTVLARQEWERSLGLAEQDNLRIVIRKKLGLLES